MVYTRKPLDCVLLEKYTVAPAPSRDYFGIKANISNIYLYRWRIMRSCKTVPTVQHIDIDKFLHNSSLHEEVEYIFGEDILTHLLLIAKGMSDYITVLPRPILTHIISFLPLQDLASLACTCKKMSKMVAQADDIWKCMYHKYFSNRKILKEEKIEASFRGWCKLFKKIYLSSKSKPGSLSELETSRVKKCTRPSTTRTKNQQQPLLNLLSAETRPKSTVNIQRNKSVKVYSTSITMNKTVRVHSAPKLVNKKVGEPSPPKPLNETMSFTGNSTILTATSNLSTLALPSSRRPKTVTPKKTAITSPKSRSTTEATKVSRESCSSKLTSPRSPVKNNIKPLILSKSNMQSSTSLKSPRLIHLSR